jgi:hypothetical protein
MNKIIDSEVINKETSNLIKDMLSSDNTSAAGFFEENCELLLDYEEIEEYDWEDCGKTQSGGGIYKVVLPCGHVIYINTSESRSGSYYTDWYHTIDDVSVVPYFKGTEELTVNFKFEGSSGNAEEILTILSKLDKIGYTFTSTTTTKQAWD